MEDILDYQRKYVNPLIDFFQEKDGFIGINLCGPPLSGKTRILKSFAENIEIDREFHCIYLDLELLQKDDSTSILKKIIKEELQKAGVTSKQILSYFSNSHSLERDLFKSKRKSEFYSLYVKRLIIIIDHITSISAEEQQEIIEILRVLRSIPVVGVVVSDFTARFLPLTINIGFLNETELAQFWAGKHTPSALLGDFPIIDPGKNHTPGSLINFFSQYLLIRNLYKAFDKKRRSDIRLLTKMFFLQYQWPELFDRVCLSLEREPNILLALESIMATRDESERENLLSVSPTLLSLSSDQYLKRLLGAPPFFINIENVKRFIAAIHGEVSVDRDEKKAEAGEDIWSSLISGDLFNLSNAAANFGNLDYERQEDYLHRLLAILIDSSLDDEMRSAASLALAKIAPERSLRQLEYVLDSTSDPGVRQWVVKTLGLLRLPESKDLLSDMLRKDKLEVVGSSADIFIDANRDILRLENDLKRREASLVRLEVLNIIEALPLDETRDLLENVRERDPDPLLRGKAHDILRLKA